MVQVRGLDHLVLVVADQERALSWYCGELGLQGVRVGEWRAGTAPFPSARVDEATILDFVAGDSAGGGQRNLDHLCLVIEPTDLEALASSGRFPGARGPLPLFGARGVGTAIYVEDPDGNTVELRQYG